MPVAERPVLVAPDSFKGTFSAPQVAGAVCRGLERAGAVPADTGWSNSARSPSVRMTWYFLFMRGIVPRRAR